MSCKICNLGKVPGCPLCYKVLFPHTRNMAFSEGIHPFDNKCLTLSRYIIDLSVQLMFYIVLKSIMKSLANTDYCTHLSGQGEEAVIKMSIRHDFHQFIILCDVIIQLQRDLLLTQHIGKLFLYLSGIENTSSSSAHRWHPTTYSSLMTFYNTWLTADILQHTAHHWHPTTYSSQLQYCHLYFYINI